MGSMWACWQVDTVGKHGEGKAILTAVKTGQIGIHPWNTQMMDLQLVLGPDLLSQLSPPFSLLALYKHKRNLEY